jgi:hypothetical protein
LKIDPENISDFLNECEFAPFVFSYDSRGEIFRRNRSFDKLLDGSGLSNVSDILVNFRPFFSDDQYHGVISMVLRTL